MRVKCGKKEYVKCGKKEYVKPLEDEGEIE